MRSIVASAPGRICLFGEHQDYLGLPVIAAAVDLRITGIASIRTDDVLSISMPDIGDTLLIDPNSTQTYTSKRDYIRSAITVLQRQGVRWPIGLEIVIRSEIPINAGVSSSSAMTVMWLRLLLETGESTIEFDTEKIARFAYAAEVTEFREPGGMMDHFACAVGGVIAVDTVSPFKCVSLPFSWDGFVIGNSEEPKATIETLLSRRNEVREGIRQIKSKLPQFQLATTPYDECLPYLSMVDEMPRKRLIANLNNRDITKLAHEAIVGGDMVRFGNLLNSHHIQLRDGLDLSTPKLEAMLNASLEAGALGGKVNGSGGGGTMFAFAPGRQEEVAEAIRSAGGVPYIVQVDTGVRTGS